MASMLNFLSLTFFLISACIAVALPVELDEWPHSTQLPVNFTEIRVFNIWTTSIVDYFMLVPDNGTFFNPNPAIAPVERICIDINTPACAFGSEDGAWVVAFNYTNNGCIDISPALIFNNGFCCVTLDHCDLLDQPFLTVREADPPIGLTELEIFAASDSVPDHRLVLNSGDIFNPNPQGSSIERICIGKNTTSCAFGAEDGSWITALNDTNNGCVYFDPPQVLKEGLCCIKPLDQCNTPSLPPRPSPSLTAVTIIQLSPVSAGELPFSLRVENTGDQVTINPNNELIGRVCMETHETMSCGLGASDGTWIQLYNDTNYLCSNVDPPAAVNTVVCCTDDTDCPALDRPFRRRIHSVDLMKVHHMARAADPVSDASPTAKLGLISDQGFRYRTIQANGSTFYFDQSADQVSAICIEKYTMTCIFQAADGTAYPLWTFDAAGCVDIDISKGVSRGFCCSDMSSCSSVNSHTSISEVEKRGDLLENRGLAVNATLAILYESSPNLVGWELVLTDFRGFNVTKYVPWTVGQICINSTTAICAFVGEDGTNTVVIGGRNSNCVVVGPPQIIIDGVCCNSTSQCDGPSAVKMNQLAPYLLQPAEDGNTNTSVAASNSSFSPRGQSTTDLITVQYFGADSAYEFNFVTGDWKSFQTPSFTVDKVCIISPSGACGFWDPNGNPTVRVGYVAQGNTGYCEMVGPPQLLAGGICCDPAVGCNPDHPGPPSTGMLAPRSVQNGTAVDSTAVTSRQVTFMGSNGRVTVLKIPVGQYLLLDVPGQPFSAVCIDSGSCDFNTKDAFSYEIGTHGCLVFYPHAYLNSVICL